MRKASPFGKSPVISHRRVGTNSFVLMIVEDASEWQLFHFQRFMFHHRWALQLSH
jgi:hypothetical protein